MSNQMCSYDHILWLATYLTELYWKAIEANMAVIALQNAHAPSVMALLDDAANHAVKDAEKIRALGSTMNKELMTNWKTFRDTIQSNKPAKEIPALQPHTSS